MKLAICVIAASLLLAAGGPATAPTESSKPAPGFDAARAGKYGADKNGLKHYVLAILKTGPAEVAEGPERDGIFKGHFANIKRLADEGKLVVAGPFGQNSSGFRGIFILNVPTVAEAKQLTDTDPVVKSGIMVVDLYPWYGSAALMAVPEVHETLSEKTPQPR